MRHQEYRGLFMLTSDKNAEPTIVKFPIQNGETEREWRLDDTDAPPTTEKEWKLDDTDPLPPETLNVEVDLSSEPSPNPPPEKATLPETPPSDVQAATPPVAPQPKSPSSSHWRVYGALLGAVVLSVWFSHQSINAYWQQTYHKASPLEPLNHFALWQMGAKAQNVVNGWLASDSSPNAENDLAAENDSPPIPQTPQSPTTETTPSRQPETASAPNLPTQNGERIVLLHSGDKVLFVGDSIMQGIAPHLQRRLKSEHQIDSLNLSKQSTGLAYPKFFDWPTTIEQTLQKEPNIKLIVVLLGANDPWDFPNPQGGAYLKFQSPEWNAEYLNRVNRIVQAAEQNQARIIWLGVPYMRRVDLDKGVRHLNHILGNELVGKLPTVIWLPTDMLLSDTENYQDSMTIDGETVRIRTKDGIHLNTTGQIFMSNYLNSYIQVQ